ncbi:hypothetical protein D9M68_947010 [compost metagenome]
MICYRPDGIEDRIDVLAVLLQSFKGLGCLTQADAELSDTSGGRYDLFLTAQDLLLTNVRRIGS